MSEATPVRRRSFKVYAALSGLLLTFGAAAALFAGVTPASAAELASQPDMQIAVFLVPVTLLLLTVLFEVVRFAWRGPLPVEAARAVRTRSTLAARSR